jgi:uncharacterized protein YndB with AHSA1/START domain
LAHPFEIKAEVEVDASPEQVWEAITDGPKLDSWFMGRNEIEPREGGTARMDYGDFAIESTVLAWEPSKRFVIRTNEAPDGTFMRFEYLIEGRGGGKTLIRYVHSGFLGDNWETEYEALKEGDPLYLHQLAQYLEHFSGRIAASNIIVYGPQVADKERVWAVLQDRLGLSDAVALGERVRATPEGLPPIDGIVHHTSPNILGLRASDSLYCFLHAPDGTLFVERHIFSDEAAQRETAADWQAWLARVFAESEGLDVANTSSGAAG